MTTPVLLIALSLVGSASAQISGPMLPGPGGPAASGGSPPSFVNCDANDSGGGVTQNVQTSGKSLTAGNSVFVIASAVTNGGCGGFGLTISDLAGNTYTQVGSYVADPSLISCSGVFAATGATTGNASNWYKVHSGTGYNTFSISAMQITPAVLDTTASGTAASATSATTGTFTAANNSLAIFGGAATQFSHTWSAGTGYTLDSSCTAPFTLTTIQYKQFSSGGSGNTADINITTATNLSILGGTFK